MDHWWLCRLFVDGSYRREGVGTELLRRAMLLVATTETVSRVTVAPGGYGTDVEWLTRWYLKRGFNVVEGEEGLLELDALDIR